MTVCHPAIPASARQAIIRGIYAGDPASNLARLGLPSRVLGLLEKSRYQIVTLEDLVSLSRDEVLSIKLLGEKSLAQILECLCRYDELRQPAATFLNATRGGAIASADTIPV